MIAKLYDGVSEVVFTLLTVPLLHFLRAARVALRADFQVVTWKAEKKTRRVKRILSTRGQRGRFGRQGVPGPAAPSPPKESPLPASAGPGTSKPPSVEEL